MKASDAARTLLRYCLNSDTPSQVAGVLEQVQEEDIPDPSLRLLYGACGSLAVAGKSVDSYSVDAYLRTNAEKLASHFARVPGKTVPEKLEHLGTLAIELTVGRGLDGTPITLSSAVDCLRNASEQMRALEILGEAHEKVAIGGDDIQSAVEEAVTNLLSIRTKHLHLRNYVTLEDAVEEATRETETEMSGKIVRLNTGFAGLNSLIYGYEKGRLYLLAGEEKTAKSLILGQGCLVNAQEGHAVGIITMEMRASELAKRYAAVNSGQPPSYRLGPLRAFHERSKGVPLFIREGSATPAKILTIARKLFMEKRIELLAIDYINLVEFTGHDRVNDLNDLASKLKGLAMDLQIPILVIAAILNKQVNQRGRDDRRPNAADIRDSGRLVYDADATLMMWRPDPSDEEYLELFVERTRYSKKGEIGLKLDPTTLRLTEVSVREQLKRKDQIRNAPF
jgi:replicative DNA helicase